MAKLTANGITVVGCTQVEGPAGKPVLRVAYHTDEEEDLEADLPMAWEPFDSESGFPGEWMPDEKAFSPLQAALWEACADAAAAYDERRFEA